MKRKKMYSRIAKRIASGLAFVGVTASGNVVAAQGHHHHQGHQSAPKAHVIEHEKREWDLGGGWKLGSQGGVSFIHPDNADYWFKLSGLLRLDSTLFMGSARDKMGDFPSGSKIRVAELYFDGGVGPDWDYTLALSFTGPGTVSISDTWIAYSGFLPNNQVFFGRVQGNWFGLDNSNSGSWNPFLERSLVTRAFGPEPGLGVMTDMWWDQGAVTLSVMAPDHMASWAQTKRDRWHGTLRGTFAPVHELGDVWHFGVSGAYAEFESTLANTAFDVGSGGAIAVGRPIMGPSFKVGPGGVARNTADLVNTTTGNPNYTSVVNGQLQHSVIRANNVRSFNIEAARQCGPWMLEGDYTTVYVHRVGDPTGTLTFDGWNLQTRYLLTGEAHEYDVRDGSFGSVKPNHSYGAWEIAARYDGVNLNNKNLRGGSERNVSLGLNWFYTDNIRVSLNYIRAAIHPANDAPKRNLDIVGMRVQLRFK